MSLPRISRRRRLWLKANLSPAATAWIEKRDPIYLLTDTADIIARSVDIARARPRLQAAPDRLFCDLGFNTRRVFNYFYDAMGPDYRWCGFEIQDALHAAAVADQGRYATGPVQFIHGAAAEADGTISIALEGKSSGDYVYEGSTTVPSLVRDKAGAARLEVPSYDLAAYLEANSGPDTKIVIKMDIEGGEYQLLPHLLNSAVGPRIDLIFCEFHWRRFPVGQRLSHLFQTLDLIKRYDERGALLLSWR